MFDFGLMYTLLHWTLNPSQFMVRLTKFPLHIADASLKIVDYNIASFDIVIFYCLQISMNARSATILVAKMATVLIHPGATTAIARWDSMGKIVPKVIYRMIFHFSCRY